MQTEIENMGSEREGHELAQRKHLSSSLPHEGEQQSLDSDGEQEKQDSFDQCKTAFFPPQACQGKQRRSSHRPPVSRYAYNPLVLCPHSQSLL